MLAVELEPCSSYWSRCSWRTCESASPCPAAQAVLCQRCGSETIHPFVRLAMVG